MLTGIVHQMLRWFFVGRTVHRLGDLGPLRVIQSSGKIVGYDSKTFEAHCLDTGNDIRDLRRVKLNRLKYDRYLKSWTYYD